MISIIIPAYNEEEQIGRLVLYLKKHTTDVKTQIIVVDGGSSDKTKSVAENAGATVLLSPEKGRAHQMNYGAEHAHGEWLYFLHADTLPPPDFDQLIMEKTKQGFECGCFRLKFDHDHPALRFYSWFTRFDLDVFRFGDQSLFVKKKLFKKINGFNAKLLVMEDQEIISRLKSHAQFSIISEPVTTSARKYQRFGLFKLQLIFTIIVFLYYSKVSQKTLAHFYKTYMAGPSY